MHPLLLLLLDVRCNVLNLEALSVAPREFTDVATRDKEAHIQVR